MNGSPRKTRRGGVVKPNRDTLAEDAILTEILGEIVEGETFLSSFESIPTDPSTSNDSVTGGTHQPIPATHNSIPILVCQIHLQK